jgi:uncharacterized protein
VRREAVIKLLVEHKSQLKLQFGVCNLGLFGSTARDTAMECSDVDILVSFDSPATSQKYFGVQFYLEDIFNCPVDLITEKALRKELRHRIECDLVKI